MKPHVKIISDWVVIDGKSMYRISDLHTIGIANDFTDEQIIEWVEKALETDEKEETE